MRSEELKGQAVTHGEQQGDSLIQQVDPLIQCDQQMTSAMFVHNSCPNSPKKNNNLQ